MTDVFERRRGRRDYAARGGAGARATPARRRDPVVRDSAADVSGAAAGTVGSPARHGALRGGVELQKRLGRARQAGRDPRRAAPARAPSGLHEGAAHRAGASADGRGLVPDAGHRGLRDRPRRPGHLPRARAARGLSDLEAPGRRRPRVRQAPGARDDRRARRLRRAGSGLRRAHRRLDGGRPADRGRRGRPAAHPRRGAGDAGRRGAQDRLDRHPREQGRHDPRARGQRQQRPAAVRLGRPVRDRGRADDLGLPASSAPSRTSMPSRPPSATGSPRSSAGHRSRWTAAALEPVRA